MFLYKAYDKLCEFARLILYLRGYLFLCRFYRRRRLFCLNYGNFLYRDFRGRRRRGCGCRCRCRRSCRRRRRSGYRYWYKNCFGRCFLTGARKHIYYIGNNATCKESQYANIERKSVRIRFLRLHGLWSGKIEIWREQNSGYFAVLGRKQGISHCIVDCSVGRICRKEGNAVPYSSKAPGRRVGTQTHRSIEDPEDIVGVKKERIDGIASQLACRKTVLYDLSITPGTDETFTRGTGPNGTVYRTCNFANRPCRHV